MDRRTDLLIGATAANVGNFAVDICVSGFGLVPQKRSDSHDHATLAIAALRHVLINPGLLDSIQDAVLRESFDGCNFLPDSVTYLHSAGTRRSSVDMDRASAALGYAASIFCSGHANAVSDHPEQWGVRFDIDVVGLSVDREAEHGSRLAISREKDALFGSEKCVATCIGYFCAYHDVTPDEDGSKLSWAIRTRSGLSVCPLLAVVWTAFAFCDDPV